MRLAGYYWIKYNHEWIVAYFDPKEKEWYSYVFLDKKIKTGIQEINERLIKRTVDT